MNTTTPTHDAGVQSDVDDFAWSAVGHDGACWDAVVIGAGPAGSAAAIELARAGARTLLVDRAEFPRDKVCGCCLTQAALVVLDDLGVGASARERGAPLREAELCVAGRSAFARMPGGVSLSRRWLDAALVDRARELGVAWLPRVSADVIGPAERRGDQPQPIELTTRDGRSVVVHARAVIAADGLGGRSLGDSSAFAWRVARRSHIGLGARLPASPGCDGHGDGGLGIGGETMGDATDNTSSGLPSGRLRMAVGRGGYVGLVRLEDGSNDLAAAVSPRAVRALGGPVAAVRAILHEAGGSRIGVDWADVRLTGTPALTRRRRRVAHGRVFVVGDAAGYVEPFTGEGVTWALAGGAACGRTLAAWLSAGQPVGAVAATSDSAASAPEPAGVAGDEAAARRAVTAWMRRHRALLGRRQLGCRLVAIALRWPWLLSGLAWFMSQRPGVADRLAGWVHAGLERRWRPSTQEIA